MRFQFPSDLLYLFCQMVNKQKYRRILYFCIILMMISGIAAGADRDVIIGFKNKPGPSEEALVHSHGGMVKKIFHLIPAMAAKVPDVEIAGMKKDPRIAYIEDDQIYEAADEYTDSWGVQHIGSQLVHNNSITGAGINIAILDTGIDYNHEDLDANYKGGIGFVQDSSGNVNPSNFDDSSSSHGTHVAGIIAAEHNGIGVVGVAPNANIYAVKVLDGAGFGLDSWIISGIQWAVDNNMNIASISIQGSDSQALHDATDAAYNSGVLLVAAGGNGGAVRYPAAYDSVIAVSSTDITDQIASSSSIGPEIELAAPGVNIYSTIRGGYGVMSGTSMAAPHVTGVAALIWGSNFQDINNDGLRNNKDIRIILQNSAKDLGVFGRDNTYGFGLVDAPTALFGFKLTLIRTTGPEINDAKSANISQGNYKINIHNFNLAKVDMKVYENGVIRKDLSYSFKFNKSNDINFDINVEDTLKIVFIPYGSKGSTGYVTITRL